jgi:succinate-acetate transporter protein
MAVVTAAVDESLVLVHPAPKEEVELAPPGNDPALLGLPSFIVGAVALGLVNVGMVPAGVAGAAIPILVAATSIGMFIAAIWAVHVGQGVVGGIYGLFAGFYLSDAVLVLGLTHNWFGIPLTAIVSTQKVFLIAWLIVIVMLTLGLLRLPVLYPVLLGLVDVTLLLFLLGVTQTSPSLIKASGYVSFIFCALGAYLFLGVMNQATGGRPFPLGKPILHS